MRKIAATMSLMMVLGWVWAEVPGTWKFNKDGLTVVVVGKDAEDDENRSYQVVVSNELRSFVRLEVNRDGLVTDAWMTDLNRDGAFEIVVATIQLDGNVGTVDIHEWRDFRFDSKKTADLVSAQRAGYRGNDQFTVIDGELRRSYPVFAVQGGGPVPTGEMANFRYRYTTGDWAADPE